MSVMGMLRQLRRSSLNCLTSLLGHRERLRADRMAALCLNTDKAGRDVSRNDRGNLCIGVDSEVCGDVITELDGCSLCKANASDGHLRSDWTAHRSKAQKLRQHSEWGVTGERTGLSGDGDRAGGASGGNRGGDQRVG